jgi:hypothetical protein
MALVRMLAAFLLCGAAEAWAGGVAVRFGPPAVGNGGSNPISIPPAVRDMGLSYVTDKGTEFNLAVTGLSIALREKAKWGGYTSLGGGLAFDANGGGIGPYAAFGVELGCGTSIGCFSAEFSHALGFGSRYVASPSALRLGIMKWF